MVNPHPRPAAGFTLLEILVAFTLLATVFSVLLRVFSSGVQGIAITAQYEQATALARSLLLTTDVDTAAAGMIQGEFENGFRWWREIAPYQRQHAEDQPQTRGLYHIAVEVNWQSPLGGRSVRLDTLRLKAPEGVL
jgi:general secretion pathway protein I